MAPPIGGAIKGNSPPREIPNEYHEKQYYNDGNYDENGDVPGLNSNEHGSSLLRGLNAWRTTLRNNEADTGRCPHYARVVKGFGISRRNTKFFRIRDERFVLIHGLANRRI